MATLVCWSSFGSFAHHLANPISFLHLSSHQLPQQKMEKDCFSRNSLSCWSLVMEGVVGGLVVWLGVGKSGFALVYC